MSPLAIPPVLCGLSPLEPVAPAAAKHVAGAFSGDPEPRRSSLGTRQRRQIDAPGAPEGSPGPCASKETSGRCGGGRSSPEASPWR